MYKWSKNKKRLLNLVVVHSVKYFNKYEQRKQKELKQKVNIIEMKRIICINWMIFCFFVNVNVASGNNKNETNIQNVKREIEFNKTRNAYKENVGIVNNVVALNALENGIKAVENSVCSTDLKLMTNGLETRMPWAISSK